MLKGKKVEEGAYGKVYVAIACNDGSPDPEEFGKSYALKRNIMEDDVDFAGNMRELDILLRLKKHPNIVDIEHIIYGEPFHEDDNGRLSPIKDGYKDDILHFVLEYAETDLHKFIYNFMKLSDINPILVDTLLGLEYMHHNFIVHRDIKPGNLLIFFDKEDRNRPPTLKICDFGLSKHYTMQEPQTPSMVTAWYRAPEIAMGNENYDYKVDVWSLGCIIYQMLTKKSGFIECRNDDKEVLTRILQQLPKRLPPSETRKLKEKYAIRLPRGKRKAFRKDLFPTQEDIDEFNEKVGDVKIFVELVESMLSFFPEDRPTISEILDHPFFDDFREKIRNSREIYLEDPSKKCFTDEDLLITIMQCRERKWGVNFAMYFYNRHSTVGVRWYKHRIIFQAIDLFDRYLEHTTRGDKTPVRMKSAEEEFAEQVQYELRFLTCVYISIKFFATLETPVSYLDISEELFSIEGTQEFAKNFEKELLEKVFKYYVYRPTVLEYADQCSEKLSSTSIAHLLWAYGTCKSKENIHLKDLYTELRQMRIDGS